MVSRAPIALGPALNCDDRYDAIDRGSHPLCADKPGLLHLLCKHA